jgi:hypothetical protein
LVATPHSTSMLMDERKDLTDDELAAIRSLLSIQKTLTKALGETLSFDTEAKKDTT